MGRVRGTSRKHGAAADRPLRSCQRCRNRPHYAPTVPDGTTVSRSRRRNSPPPAGAWRSIPFVTVDTEFLRETTYYPLLCVAQMASADEAVVVDALAPGIDLTPFFELMANEKVMKVFHAARQDIEIVWHRAKLIPHPIFDTQVAAMVLGYGDSISYDQLVQRITGDTLDKSHRFTDWTRRPLSEAQLTYAISDVTHLRDVYLALVADLGSAAASIGCRKRCTSHLARHLPDGAGNAWQRLKTRVRKPKELAVLIEVAAWREREAQSRDVPRSRVLKDEVIADIAVQAPTTLERLGICARCPRVSNDRAGAKRSSMPSSAGSRATPRRCRVSSAPAAARTARRRSNC